MSSITPTYNTYGPTYGLTSATEWNTHPAPLTTGYYVNQGQAVTTAPISSSTLEATPESFTPQAPSGSFNPLHLESVATVALPANIDPKTEVALRRAYPHVNWQKAQAFVQAGEQKISNGAKELGIAKLIFGGLLMPIFNMGAGMHPAVTFTMEMIGSAAEALLAKKLIDSKSMWTQKVLTWMNKLPGGNGKQAHEMSHEEKHKALVPISIASSIIPNLISGLITRKKWEHKAIEHLKEKKGLHWLGKLIKEESTHLPGSKVGRLAQQFTRGIQKTNIRFFGYTIASAVVLAWIEGIMAKKMAKSQHAPGEHFRYYS